MTSFTPNCTNNSPSYNGVLHANIQYNAELCTRKSPAKKASLIEPVRWHLIFTNLENTRNLVMLVFRSSKQLSNVCSRGGCSSRSTQRQRTTSTHIWHRQPHHKETQCLLFSTFFILIVSILSSTKWAVVAISKYLACNAANGSTVYYASAAPS